MKFKYRIYINNLGAFVPQWRVNWFPFWFGDDECSKEGAYNLINLWKDLSKNKGKIFYED